LIASSSWRRRINPSSRIVLFLSSASTSPRRASSASRSGCFCSILTISEATASVRVANPSILSCSVDSARSLAASAAS